MRKTLWYYSHIRLKNIITQSRHETVREYFYKHRFALFWGLNQYLLLRCWVTNIWQNTKKMILFSKKKHINVQYIKSCYHNQIFHTVYNHNNFEEGILWWIEHQINICTTKKKYGYYSSGLYWRWFQENQETQSIQIERYKSHVPYLKA